MAERPATESLWRPAGLGRPAWNHAVNWKLGHVSGDVKLQHFPVPWEFLPNRYNSNIQSVQGLRDDFSQRIACANK